MAKDEDKGEQLALIKKLSAKIIMGETAINQRLIIESGRKELDLFRVAGIAVDSKTGESNFGQWVALIGKFQSLNLLTGEVMRAAKLFLPDVALEMIQGEMAAQGPEGRGIGFAFIIGVKLDEAANSAKGYVYYAKPVMAPAVDDPMEKLLSALPAPKIKALPEPKEAKAAKG